MSFKRFETQDIVISSDSITGPAWSNGVTALTSFFTSSIQAAGSSGDYYLDVFQSDPIVAPDTSVTQFSIAYCDSLGSGSVNFNDAVPFRTPTLSNFGQYRTLVLEDENSEFIFGDNTNLLTASNFYAISVDRARYKEAIFPGSFNLTLSASNGFKKIHLTDNSNVLAVNTFLGSTRVMQVVSGSNGTPVGVNGYVEASGSYGLFLPDLGTILLNPAALSQSLHLNTSRSRDLSGENEDRLFQAIKDGANFSLSSQETISSDFVFVRLRNSEFNYSENPSFISGSTGELIYNNFINQPQVYITTVGMYNDSNELLAVAKLSRPLLKDFTKEALVRVKLDF